MSQKITSKNLSYDSNLPPFLRNLHAQAGGNGNEPNPNAQRRSVKKRSGSEDAEDVPVVVDEEGNVVANVEVDKEGMVKSETLEGDDDDDADGEGKDNKAEKKAYESSKAGIGGRKRKVGKVIGEAAEEKLSDPATKDGPEKRDKADEKSEEPAKEKKSKKKAKKIKLSFDDEDG